MLICFSVGLVLFTPQVSTEGQFCANHKLPLFLSKFKQLRLRWNDGLFEELNGSQTPPVNWTINSPFKRVFFERVAEITGHPGTE